MQTWGRAEISGSKGGCFLNEAEVETSAKYLISISYALLLARRRVALTPFVGRPEGRSAPDECKFRGKIGVGDSSRGARSKIKNMLAGQVRFVQRRTLRNSGRAFGCRIGHSHAPQCPSSYRWPVHRHGLPEYPRRQAGVAVDLKCLHRCEYVTYTFRREHRHVARYQKLVRSTQGIERDGSLRFGGNLR